MGNKYVPHVGKWPRWCPEQEQCGWCFQPADLQSACVSEGKDAVEMWYMCQNPKCEHLKILKKNNRFGFIREGIQAVAAFEKKLSEPASLLVVKQVEE